MATPAIAPYGSWKSPFTSDLIVSETIRLGQITLDGDDLYWVESRPTEGGRNVIVRLTPNGESTSLTPHTFNARTRVHEYGGGAFLVADGVIYFSNFSDQRLYRQRPGSPPDPLTPEQGYCFADGIMDRRRNRIMCLREDHTDPDREPVNTIVGLPLGAKAEDNAGQVLVSGHDFYSTPRLSLDGTHMAWLAWNHPNMPWDGTELWVGEINPDGAFIQTHCVAGGPEESIFQPEWSPDGILHFVSDRTGWWNLYRLLDHRTEALCPMEAEFGEPQWILGVTTYGFESPTRLVCTYTQQGIWHLAVLDTGTGRLDTLDTPYTEIGGPTLRNGRVICTASSPSEPLSIIQLDLETQKVESLRGSVNFKIDPQYLSLPQAIEFPTEGERTAHAFFYKPRNADFQAPATERPPLMVKSHGGPTGSTSTAFNLMIQYWTSRGFAVLDVNYGGSTGYGRAYRERLNDQWGIVDVDDCVNAVRYVIDRGEVDEKRVTITGGSAGGYTTLAALTFRDCFTAGSSYYGVSDLEALVRDTHKFESRYLDRLVGPYPERQDLYHERSPIYFTDRLSCPLILFQGLEDKVVPPNQAEKMFEAVRAKGLPVAYVPFEGEQHGFRRAENIKRVLDNELYFYSKIFGFQAADYVEPLVIENLP